MQVLISVIIFCFIHLCIGSLSININQIVNRVFRIGWQQGLFRVRPFGLIWGKQYKKITLFFLFFFIDIDELNAIYLMSLFEEGLLGSSIWSPLWLSKDELDIMEYIQDFRVNSLLQVFSSSLLQVFSSKQKHRSIYEKSI